MAKKITKCKKTVSGKHIEKPLWILCGNDEAEYKGNQCLACGFIDDSKVDTLANSLHSLIKDNPEMFKELSKR